jgi:hypothetical protein
LCSAQYHKLHDTQIAPVEPGWYSDLDDRNKWAVVAGRNLRLHVQGMVYPATKGAQQADFVARFPLCPPRERQRLAGKGDDPETIS